MIGEVTMKYCSNCNKFSASHFIQFCPYCGSRFDTFNNSDNETDADYELAENYFYGKGVNKNYLTALKYYKKAAKKGLVEAINDVGEFYYCNLRTPSDGFAEQNGRDAERAD